MPEAVIAHTRTAAFAEFAEKDKGTLETGKLADLVVLSHDIFKVPLDAVARTESLLTMVGGKIVYDASASSTR
jgi:predicted amidohydrolase YtcJ